MIRMTLPRTTRPGADARRHVVRGIVPALGLALTLVLAGCGDDSSASASRSSSDAAGVKAARAAYDQLQQPTEGLGDLTEPLTSKPEPGQTVVFMDCGSAVCSAMKEQAEEVADLVGWDLRSISYSLADAATLTAGLGNALQFDPVAVLVVGTDPALWTTAREQLVDAGVAVIGLTQPSLETSQDPPVINILGEEGLAANGRALADWFIADSEGQGRAALVSIPAIPLYQIMTDAFEAELAQNCPNCQSTIVELTPEMVASGQIPQTIVGALRQDPNITHVASLTGNFLIGLNAQLRATGLAEQVTLGSAVAGPDNLPDIESGTIATLFTQSIGVETWAAMDAAFRVAQGMEIPQDAYNMLPATNAITANNIDATDDPLDNPADFRDDFRALWLLDH